MKFKRTMVMRSTIKKKKEYEFEDFELIMKSAKKSTWEKPKLIIIGALRYLAYYTEQDKFNLDAITGIVKFEELNTK